MLFKLKTENKQNKKKNQSQKMPKTRLCCNCSITTITKSKDNNSRFLFNGTYTSNLQFPLEKQHCRLLQFAMTKQFLTTEIKTFRVAYAARLCCGGSTTLYFLSLVVYVLSSIHRYL